MGSPSEYIRLARLRAGLEPEQVAEATGLNKAWIYDLEGRDDEVTDTISLRTLWVLARTLGTSPLQLVDGPEAIAPPSHRSPTALAGLTRARIEEEGLTVAMFGNRIDWKIEEFLETPETIWDNPLAMLQALCNALGVDWREGLVQEPT